MEKLGMDRQALHARRFGYLDGEENFEAEIPSDFKSFLENRMGFKWETIKNLLKNANFWEDEQVHKD
jgi:hypothetical protein